MLRETERRKGGGRASAEKNKNKEKEKGKEGKDEKSKIPELRQKTCMQRLTFGWIYPLIKHAYDGHQVDQEILTGIDIQGGISEHIERF